MGIALYSAVQSGIALSILSKASLITVCPGCGTVAIQPFGAAVIGALVGAAVVALILEYTGIGRGLPPALAYALIIAGAYVGASVGLGFLASGGALGFGPLPFAGPLFFIVFIYFIFCFIAGCGDVREIEVKFSCRAWQPPTGGADCDECNKNELGCSKYKCQSYGQTCEFVNEGTDEEICFDSSPNDASPPIINVNPDAIGEDVEYVGPQENIGTKIESSESSDGCIKEYGIVQFGISLNEPGQCKFTEEHTNSYSQMNDYFGGSNLYRYDHSTVMAMPTLSSLGIPGIDPSRRGNYNLYVRCQDANGNANVREYAIEFCVAPADDLTAPIITFDPESPGYAGVNTTEKLITLFTNEPAECKWSATDQIYENMENYANCENEISDVTPDGWVCNAILPMGEEEEQEFYFRCLDQPWLKNTEQEGDRNANGESVLYTVIRSTEELVISYIDPDDEILVFASAPVSIDLEIHTDGGIDGNALCEFSFDSENYAGFFFTGTTVHRQTFSTLLEGSYNIYLQCVDIGENVAYENAVFDVEIDNIGPIITRVYNQAGSLTVVTNENSECAYDFESCGFIFENGTLMSGSGLVHTTGFNRGSIYHIKCRDNFGNTGNCLKVSGGY